MASQNTRIAAGLTGVGVMCVLVWLAWPTPAEPTLSLRRTAVAPDRVMSLRVPRAGGLAVQTEVPEVEPEVASPEAVEAAFEQVFPDLLKLRCGAAGLDDGIYRAHPAGKRLPVTRGSRRCGRESSWWR